jgi:hypothetical protein
MTAPPPAVTCYVRLNVCGGRIAQNCRNKKRSDVRTEYILVQLLLRRGTVQRTNDQC